MSFRTTVHESLAYIDQEPTPDERSAAESLIQAELAQGSSTSDEPLAALPEPKFSTLVTQELDRVASKKPLRAIDTSRYESPDDDDELPSSSSAMQSLLSRAYTTRTYIAGRQVHLSLLEAFGKNAWLTGNWHVEGELKSVERDLAAVRREIDLVNLDRRRAQDEVGEELVRLEKGWKDGVGRVLETEIAVETLRQQILQERRADADTLKSNW